MRAGIGTAAASAIILLEIAAPRPATAAEPFIRGDVSEEGRLDISDAIAILHVLDGRVIPVCLRVADADDDGTIGLADPSVILWNVGTSPR